MTDFDKIRDAFLPRQDEARVQQMWRVVTEAQPTSSVRPHYRWAMGAATVALLLLGIFVAYMSRVSTEPVPLTLASGRPVPERLGGDDVETVRFADRSALRIKGGTALELLENAGASVAFALRRGRVRFDITPGGPRTWKIACGNVSVEVLGTSFVLERLPSYLHVSVSRGAVLVKGARVEDGVQKLAGGQSLTVPLSRLAPSTLPADIDNAVLKAPVKLAAASAPSNGSAPAPKPAPKWRQFADHGAYDDAYETLGAEGVSALTTAAQSVDELFALADVARFSGHTNEALAPLTRIVDTHPTDSRAGLAAYTLGKLYLEQLSHFADAADAFAKADALGLPAALEEAARAKQVRALAIAGDPRAAEAGRRYLEFYPDGRYRERVESWLKQ
jgi:transmembrane sensor